MNRNQLLVIGIAIGVLLGTFLGTFGAIWTNNRWPKNTIDAHIEDLAFRNDGEVEKLVLTISLTLQGRVERNDQFFLVIYDGTTHELLSQLEYPWMTSNLAFQREDADLLLDIRILWTDEAGAAKARSSWLKLLVPGTAVSPEMPFNPQTDSIPIRPTNPWTNTTPA